MEIATNSYLNPYISIKSNNRMCNYYDVFSSLLRDIWLRKNSISNAQKFAEGLCTYLRSKNYKFL